MKKLILVFLWLIFSSASAQESQNLIFRVGYGTYSMKSQKKFQHEYNINSNVRLIKVHSFPYFPTLGISLNFPVSPSFSLGIWGEYASTGGRLHYSDYSGYAVMDQVLSTLQAGPFIQYRVNKSTSWPFYFTLHGSFAHTIEKLTSEIKVNGKLDNEFFKLKSLNYGIRPGIMIAHHLNLFVFQMGVGSELQIHGELKDKRKKDIIFRTSDGKNLTAQWDGIRLTFGIGFKLN